MTAIKQIRFRKVVRPMKTQFATSLGRKSAATSVLVDVALSGGARGLGEVPTSFTQPHESVDAIKKILAEAREELIGKPIADYGRAIADFRRRYPTFRMTVSGLEIALFRAALAAAGKTEHSHWGGRSRRVQTDITIPFLTDADMLGRWLSRVLAAGFRTYKVKVSGDIDADMRLLCIVRQALDRAGGRDFVIRLDGNQGYTVRTYLKMIDRLQRERLAVELFEQPLGKDDLAGFKAIRGRSPLPVILDETVCDAESCRRVIDNDLGDGVNIKIAKSGIAESAAILKLARRAGLKLMMGCMTETMVGLSAAIYLAAGTAAFDYLDLDSIHFLFHRGQIGPIVIDGPEYRF